MSGLEMISLLSAGLSGIGTIAAGSAQKNAADFEAQQMDMKAKEEVAASQRDALQKKHEGAIVNSRAQALAAASGGGAGTDAPTIVKLMDQTTGTAQYNADSAMYGGYSRAAGLRDSAKGKRAEGSASLLGSTLGAFGGMAKGITSTFG